MSINNNSSTSESKLSQLPVSQLTVTQLVERYADDIAKLRDVAEDVMTKNNNDSSTDENSSSSLSLMMQKAPYNHDFYYLSYIDINVDK